MGLGIKHGGNKNTLQAKKSLAKRKIIVGILTVSLIAAVAFNWQKFANAPQAYADSTSPRTATSSSDCVNDSSVGTTVWTNPGNAASVNAVSASISNNATTTSQYLKCTNFSFTGLIPTGSTITGITATIGRSGGTFGTVKDSSVRILKGGVIGATNKATATNWPTTGITAANYGGASDMWGETWSISDIESSGFGLAVSATLTYSFFSVQANIDYLQLTVHYDAPPVTIDQSGYRLYANADSADVGSPLAALNTPATLTSSGQAFRLRSLAHISTNPLQSGSNFALQFVDPGNGTCAAPSGGTPSTYTPITSDAADWSLIGSHAQLASNNGGRQVATFNGYMWFMPSGSNTIYYSSDGATWSTHGSIPFPLRHSGKLIEFDNKLWIMGGISNPSTYRNDVWYSSDGANWTQATATAGWSARAYFGATVYDNKLWVIGGETGSSSAANDVWYSSDGASWTQATASAGWGARLGIEAVTFNNTLYVMGGKNTGSTFYNEVWSSTDGASWTQEASAGWGARDRFGATVMNGKIWVVGGEFGTNSNQKYNDVWQSPDGDNWIQASAAADWSTRMNIGLISHNNKLWVLGGDTGAGTTNGEVWSADSGTVISWNINGAATNGEALTPNANDPSHSSDTIVDQSYHDTNEIGVLSQIPIGQDGMWDFSLVDAGAPEGVTYCFRLARQDGTALDSYEYYPSITTYTTPPPEPTPTPTIINKVIKGGTKIYGGTRLGN